MAATGAARQLLGAAPLLSHSAASPSSRILHRSLSSARSLGIGTLVGHGEETQHWTFQKRSKELRGAGENTELRSRVAAGYGNVGRVIQGQEREGEWEGGGEERRRGTRRRGEKKTLQLQTRGGFRERFLAALEAEKAEEMREFHVRMREWPPSRLAAEGCALFDLIPSMRGRFFKRRIVQFVASYSGPGGLLPPHHVFSPGDMVVISERHPLEDAGSGVVEGVVLERARRFLLVVVDAEDTELFAKQRKLRLDLAFNAVAYERATSAVSGFCDIAPGRGAEGVLGSGAKGALRGALSGARHSAQTRRTRQEEERKGARQGGKGAREGGMEAVLGEGVMATWQLLIGPGSPLHAATTQADTRNRGAAGRDSNEAPDSNVDSNEEADEASWDKPWAQPWTQQGPPTSSLADVDALLQARLGGGSLDRDQSRPDGLLGSVLAEGSLVSSASGPKMKRRMKAPQAAVEASRAAVDAGSSASTAAAARLKELTREALSFSSKAPPWGRGKKEAGEYKGQVRTALRSLLTSGALNTSQAAAIEGAFGRRLSLWQGPPGTGKTRTLCHFVHTAAVTLKLGRVLACADSNVAVDNMVELLQNLGANVVRIGQPVKVKESLRQATLEARLAQHEAVTRAASIRNEAMAVRAQARTLNNAGRRTDMAKRAGMMWKMAEDLESTAVVDILSKADVVAATCVGAGDPYLQLLVEHFAKKRTQVLSRSPSAKAPSAPSPRDQEAFSLCVIDEAAQATLPVSLIPLLVGGAHCTVLAGDPQQLPPTVLSREAQDLGLHRSLYSNLQDCGLVPALLDTQYRMHPGIARFPSLRFYQGRLLSFPRPQDRLAPQGFPWPDPSLPVAFVNCSEGQEAQQGGGGGTRGSRRGAAGLEESTGDTASWFNLSEAEIVQVVVRSLLERGDLPNGRSDIGVITPYSGQVKLLSDMLGGALLDGKRGGASSSQRGGRESSQRGARESSQSGGPSSLGESSEAEDGEELEIKTVDGFQGREKEVIIVSTVRSNPERRLGFVADGQRMNVTITRAKRGLIVIGDERTLSSDEHWRLWLEQAPRAALPITVGQPAETVQVL